MRRISLLLGCIFCLGGSAAAQTDRLTEQKINRLIGQMTLEEKIEMIHANGAFSSTGVPRLQIPELVMSDGPHGVRREIGHDWEFYKQPAKGINDSSTYLPVGICLAATWNPALALNYGKVLGSEASFRNKDVILGPGINIIRTPLNGRNFEYFSEDPYLVSKMAVPYIQGVQSQGVSASVKHYVANSQETNRMTINVEMSERALREIYLPGFKAAIMEGKVNTVMGAYDLFRGQHATHNHYLINQILKKEFGFDGLVMSDWGAVRNTKEALLNGLDIEMGTDMNNPKTNFKTARDLVLPLIKSGEVPVSIIDDKVRRILRVMYRTHVITKDRPKGAYNTPAHHQTALRVAEEGIVLLKNNDKILPLEPARLRSIAVIGANADRKNALGGGSSQVTAPYEITPLAGLKSALAGKISISYTEGFRIGRKSDPQADSLVRAAVSIAKTADVVIFVGGWTNKVTDQDRLFLDAETVDKPDMKLPFGQDKLITEVIKANPKTVVVLVGGGPADISAWAASTKAILQTWYDGMEGGNALANILLGKVNPSGKLPVTFPVHLEDSPAHHYGAYPGDGKNLNYKEDIYVGYRYFDTYKVKPQFAFGHGLSYTNFKMSGLQLIPKGKTGLEVVLKVTNTGQRAGAEVVQLYVHQRKTLLPRPEKELKGFAKVQLNAGQTREVRLTLGAEAFQYYNDKNKRWQADAGVFDLLIGNASDRIVLNAAYQLKR